MIDLTFISPDGRHTTPNYYYKWKLDFKYSFQIMHGVIRRDRYIKGAFEKDRNIIDVMRWSHQQPDYHAVLKDSVTGEILEIPINTLLAALILWR